MKHFNTKSHLRPFSQRSALVVVGLKLQAIHLFDPIATGVHIPQKVVHYTPAQKLQDAFISIYGPKAIRKQGIESHLSGPELDEIAERMSDNTSLDRYLDAGLLDAVIQPGDIRREVREFLERAYEKPPSRDGPRRVLCL